MIVSQIVAVSENGIIGKDNDLVWNLPDDMAFFKDKTRNHHVIMGRKNYESIPERFRPLPSRVNIVVTRQSGLDLPGCVIVNSINEAIKVARDGGESEAFIIGGGEIYRQSMEITDRIYLTLVKGTFDGDTTYPELDTKVWKVVNLVNHPADERHAFEFDFVTYER